LLLLDKADTETYNVEIKAFDLRALVQEELDSFSALAEANEIQVSFKPDALVPAELESDPVLLQQIFDTLIDNAFKYTPPKGWITVVAKRTEQDELPYLLSVTNSGPGIEEADLPHVFDRFYRSNKARSGSTAGFGLGLSIAQKLAETLGAQLSAQSVVDEYTTFTLLF
jgi:signal transduction histidine kinase